MPVLSPQRDRHPLAVGERGRGSTCDLPGLQGAMELGAPPRRGARGAMIVAVVLSLTVTVVGTLDGLRRAHAAEREAPRER